MFQTSLIHIPQTLDSGCLTVFMQIVSLLGDGDIMPLILPAVMFSPRPRAVMPLAIKIGVWSR